MNRKIKNTLEGLAAGSFALFLVGSCMGIESNIKPLDPNRIRDTSFSTYLEKGKEKMGDNLGAYVFSLFTYPGARLGTAIHNYDLPENP